MEEVDLIILKFSVLEHLEERNAYENFVNSSQSIFHWEQSNTTFQIWKLSTSKNLPIDIVMKKCLEWFWKEIGFTLQSIIYNQNFWQPRPIKFALLWKKHKNWDQCNCLQVETTSMNINFDRRSGASNFAEEYVWKFKETQTLLHCFAFSVHTTCNAWAITKKLLDNDNQKPEFFYFKFDWRKLDGSSGKYWVSVWR